jgi:CSLREA domain-containing protein
MNRTILETMAARSRVVTTRSAHVRTRVGRRSIVVKAGARIASIVMLLIALSAHGVTFTVTGPDDPAPNGCLPGDCSLREAILAANDNASVDVVEVPAGNYDLARGTLTVSGSVSVHGADGTTIEGDGTFPVFDVVGPISVTLSTLEVLGHGAHAVDIDRQTDMTLDSITVPEPEDAVHVTDPDGGTGSLAIRDSEIHADVDCGGGNACRISGSAIRSLRAGFNPSSIDVEIVRSSIDGDLGGSSGADFETSGMVTISDSTIHNGSGLRFLGLAPSSVLLDHIVFTGNYFPVLAFVPTSITVVDSTFSDNVADTFVPSYPAAILAAAGAHLDISNSTFFRNTGSGLVGGAVLVMGAAHVAIRNSTFSDNSFSAAAAAAGARGAAVGYNSDSDGTQVTLQHVTIVAPASAPHGILGTAIGGTGGGSDLVLTVLNSIVQGTCSLDADAMDTNVGNIESPGNTCDFDTGLNRIKVTTVALALGSLDDHGGATRTYLPGPLSTAIDNAAPKFCLGVDQRGYQRPFGDGCDVGAVERDAEDRVFANGFD